MDHLLLRRGRSGAELHEALLTAEPGRPNDQGKKSWKIQPDPADFETLQTLIPPVISTYNIL